MTIAALGSRHLVASHSARCRIEPYLYQARRLRRRYRRVRAGLYAAAPAQRGAAGSARDR